jgi:hypothetical protein
MRITNGKDFWAGVMFIAFGLAFFLLAIGPHPLLVEAAAKLFNYKLEYGYAMGTSVRMGPAYFPAVLGVLLAVLGAVVLFRAFVSKIENPLGVFPFKLWRISAGLVLGIAAFYTQPGHDTNIAWQFGHVLLSGLAVGLVFAAFGERSLWIVLFSVVVFGYLLKPLGLVAAVFMMTMISAVPGFDWTRKDFQWLALYAGAGILLTWVTLAVSPWIQSGVVAGFGAIGVKLPQLLILVIVEMALGGGLTYSAARYKWPHLVAGHVSVLSYILAVFSVASFVHGLGLPMNVWPSLWE